MIDTHAHLDACAEPPQVVLARARAVGVTRVIAIGSGIESCRRALALAEHEPGVECAIGIHPHQAGGDEAARLTELAALLDGGRAVAVGEIGLDFYRDYAPRDRQLSVFRAQLELAAERSLPVVVHTRAATEQTLSALATFAGTVVLHCFSAPELLPDAVERGYYLSFAGNVTYPKAAELRAAAARAPGSRILAETDAPYLAPQPVRGRPCEPAHVLHTLAALAAARGEPEAALEARIEENAAAAFCLS
ncbi:MAG TPA: TatD family hydrolase [Gaiellaceae bacterium]|nr:TatD family hydrolase [Gaiellaceae bacterium]